MARRTVLLTTAILIAALGTALVFWYVHDVNARSVARQQPVKVLIAKKVIAEGTTGAAAAAEGALGTTIVAADSVAAGALSDIAPVAGEVALAPIYPGEQILAVKFGKAGDSSALSIPDAQTMAISVSLGDTQRVNGYVVPGSAVAVYLTANNQTRLLIPRVEVIAIGTRTLVPSSGQNTTTSSDVVTFAVSAAQAQQLIYAQSAGSLYLALLTKDSETPTLPGTTSSNLFGS
jgi:pilus assembly protein CpaB